MDSVSEDLALSDDEMVVDWASTSGAYDDKPLKKATRLLYDDILRTVQPFPRWSQQELRIFRRDVWKMEDDLAKSKVPLTGLPDKSHVVDWKDADIDLLFEVALVGETAPVLNPIQGERKELCIKLSKLEELAAELKLLDRLMDRRQPQINDWPQKIQRMKQGDERGFEPPIHQEAAFRKIWLRVLHLPGLIGNVNDANLVAAESENLVQTWFMWRLSYILTRAESLRYSAHPSTDNFAVLNVPYLQWIPDLRTRVKEYIIRIKDIIIEGRPADDCELRGHMNRRLDDVNVLLQLKQVTDGFLDGNPLPRLILDLLQREYDFELALSEDHVEDRLINKQIMTFNEREFTDEFSWFDVDYISEGQARQYLKYEKGWRKIMKDVTQLNRQRFAHRLLHDWRGHRPWYKMYQLYDTASPGNQWLKGAIRDFKGKTLVSIHDDSPIQSFGEENPPPTDPRRKAARLLGIHPIDFQAEDGLRGENETPAGCTVCKKAFTPGSTIDNTIVFLHCRHLFHLKCIFEFWDAPGKYLHSCPTCGSAPLLNWQQAEIDPEEKEVKREWVHNLFGYETDNMVKTAKHPFGKLRALYDVPERPATVAEATAEGPNGYWLRENMNTLMLLDQKEKKEFPFWGAGLIGKPGRYQLQGRAAPQRDWTVEANFILGATEAREADGGNGDYYAWLQARNKDLIARNRYVLNQEEIRTKRMSDVAAVWEGRGDPNRVTILPGASFRFSEEQAARNRFRIGEAELLRPCERYMTQSKNFVLPGTRFAVEQERAYLRMKRRARNERGVEGMKAKNQGLFGLNTQGI